MGWSLVLIARPRKTPLPLPQYLGHQGTYVHILLPAVIKDFGSMNGN